MKKNIFSSTLNLAYLVQLDDPSQRMQIQFIPDQIQWDRTPYVITVGVQNRNHPLYHYNGGEDTLNLPLSFYADDLGKESALEKIQWLNSLTYSAGGPVYKVKLIFGKLFMRQTWIVQRVSSNMSGFDLLRSFKPNVANVNLRLALAPEYNISRQEAQQSF